MSPIEILVLALLGAVLVGRLRSPIARGPVTYSRATRAARPVRAPAPQGRPCTQHPCSPQAA